VVTQWVGATVREIRRLTHGGEPERDTVGDGERDTVGRAREGGTVVDTVREAMRETR
jgi:hypothetical protein